MKKAILIFMLTTVLVLSACHTIDDSSQLSKSESTTGALTEAKTESTSGTSLTTDEVTTEATTETDAQTTTQSQTTAFDNDDVVAAFAVLPHFLEENAEDYVEYHQQHPELEAKAVVTYVNIGLNRPFYTDIKTISDTDSIMVFCNKYYALADDYEPADLTALPAKYSISGRTLYLRREAADAFVELCDAAKAEGFTIIGQSAYRSYSYQKGLYDNYVLADGQAAADTYSARPGHSEHQTGLAIDVKNATHSYNQFGQTSEYQWAKDNIYKYGFVIHYIPNSEWITGYKTEEWHFRYVGVQAATEIYQLGITLDEYIATYYV